MFYNDDFFKGTKTIVRCCVDFVVDVDLEAKFYSYVLNEVRCTLKTGTRTQSYKGG